MVERQIVQHDRSSRDLRIALAVGVFAAAIGGGAYLLTRHSTPKEPSTLTFNALGGGSNVIDVYPGAQNTVADKAEDGTFLSGQQAHIVCETAGRLVMSDPSVGETPKSSDEWYKITDNGQTYFATGTYATVSGSTPPQC